MYYSLLFFYSYINFYYCTILLKIYGFPVQQITKEVDVAMGISHELMAAKASDADITWTPTEIIDGMLA